jgi:hypothetical protein
MAEREMSPARVQWAAANQRYLALRLAIVRAALQKHAARGGDAAQVSAPVDVEAQRAYPTFGLALAALAGPHWSALQPHAPLRAWRLLEVAAGTALNAPLATRPLRIDERVLHALAGLGGLDERLSRLTTPVSPAPHLVPSHAAIVERIVTSWRRSARARAVPVIVLHGPDTASARAIAVEAGRACGCGVLALGEQAIPANADDQAALARAWDREIRLQPLVLMLEADGAPGEPQRANLVRDFVDRLTAPVVVVARERLQLGQRHSLGLEVGRPATDEQRDLWSAALAGAGLDAGLDVGGLTAQFSLNATEVRAAIDEVRLAGAEAVTAAALWDACRHQARGRLDDLAQRIESRAGFDDLVLPEAQKETLADVVTQVRHRALVYDSWGFGRRGARGLGITTLFAGSSGTGKTMAAEVLANALSLDLYRVDLSSVVSKYIGETEKNLRRIFDAAEAGGAVLLFDEADALFGKRSEVKDSHDRYANVEVSYLLQRMESYRGLAILTTNLKSALDTAFLRRIRFIVEFPFPDEVDRARIWERAFPAATPTHGLDVARLAQLSVAGGGIKNVALGAAFLAADSNEPVGMAHVLRAARAEYAKLARPLTDAEVAGWI